MNIKTGQVYEGEEAIREAKSRDETLLKIPSRDLEKVKKMSLDDRKAYANKLLKRRKQNKARRKAIQKKRGRR